MEANLKKETPASPKQSTFKKVWLYGVLAVVGVAALSFAVYKNPTLFRAEVLQTASKPYVGVPDANTCPTPTPVTGKHLVLEQIDCKDCFNIPASETIQKTFYVKAFNGTQQVDFPGDPSSEDPRLLSGTNKMIMKSINPNGSYGSVPVADLKGPCNFEYGDWPDPNSVPCRQTRNGFYVYIFDYILRAGVSDFKLKVKDYYSSGSSDAFEDSNEVNIKTFSNNIPYNTLAISGSTIVGIGSSKPYKFTLSALDVAGSEVTGMAFDLAKLGITAIKGKIDNETILGNKATFEYMPNQAGNETLEVTYECQKISYPLTVTASSSTATCGNSTVETGETCDDGNVVSGDGCSSTCSVESGSCGDGAIASNVVSGGSGPGTGRGSPSAPAVVTTEECDDGNQISGDGCTSCVIDTGFTCAGTPSVCQKCGNGKVEGTEACDDNNKTPNDGCSDECAIEEGFTCAGAPSVCQNCGNSKKEGTEVCDGTDPIVTTCATATPNTPYGTLTCSTNCTLDTTNCKSYGITNCPTVPVNPNVTFKGTSEDGSFDWKLDGGDILQDAKDSVDLGDRSVTLLGLSAGQHTVILNYALPGCVFTVGGYSIRDQNDIYEIGLRSSSPTAEELLLYDTNGDGKVDAEDVYKIYDVKTKP